MRSNPPGPPYYKGGTGYFAIALLVIFALFAIREYRNRPRFEFVPNDTAVTIPEGTNIADIEKLIRNAGVNLQDRLLTKTNLALEGYLFPDTYRFDKNSAAQDVIIRMRKRYDLAVEPLSSGSSGSTAGLLIVASLLEKEVRTESDMRVVAGIIQKRLTAGMALQIDASVAYGACYPRFNLGEYCDVSQANLVDNIKKDSAYNTYTRRGLPAGPITNPGAKALRAASNPIATDYWYYLSTKDGTTIFSKTLEEHNRARAKYL